MDSQTDMFTMSRSSSHGRIAVALPLSSWRRHTNPGLPSATALMGSMAAKNVRHHRVVPVGAQACDVELGDVHRGPRERSGARIGGSPGGSSSVGRAAAFQAACREFEPRLPLHPLARAASRRARRPTWDLLHAVGDATARQVVRGELDLDPVAREHLDVVDPKLATERGKDLVVVLERDTEHRVGEGLGDHTLDLDHVCPGQASLLRAGWTGTVPAKGSPASRSSRWA